MEGRNKEATTRQSLTVSRTKIAAWRYRVQGTGYREVYRVEE